MQVVSVNVGLPRDVAWKGATVSTAIFKEPVAGKVALRSLNFDGDAQADLTVHGGPDKAVYAYPSEHYAYWQQQLGRALPHGNFGENLTTAGLLEDDVHIGDEFRAGAARLVVTQLRMPCYKLGVRFDDPTMVKAFLQSGRLGFYFAVVDEGEVGAGDAIEPLCADERRVSVNEMLRLYLDHHAPAADVRRILAIPAPGGLLREEFQSRLDKLS